MQHGLSPKRCAIIGMLILLPAAQLSAQVVRFVNAGAAPGGDGQSWATAYRHPQDALAEAAGSPGTINEIWVAAGTYMPDGGYMPVGGAHVPGTGDRSATFQLVNGIALRGGFAGDEDPATFDLSDRDSDANAAILSGDLAGNDGPDFANYDENSYHVVTASGTDATAILDGFVITAGHANGPFDSNDHTGGGMLSQAGGPYIHGCVFSSNRASHYGGGAAFTGGGQPLVEGCRFLDNTALRGGGCMATRVWISPCLIANSVETGQMRMGVEYTR